MTKKNTPQLHHGWPASIICLSLTFTSTHSEVTCSSKHISHKGEQQKQLHTFSLLNEIEGLPLVFGLVCNGILQSCSLENHCGCCQAGTSQQKGSSLCLWLWQSDLSGITVYYEPQSHEQGTSARGHSRCRTRLECQNGEWIYGYVHTVVSFARRQNTFSLILYKQPWESDFAKAPAARAS